MFRRIYSLIFAHFQFSALSEGSTQQDHKLSQIQLGRRSDQLNERTLYPCKESHFLVAATADLYLNSKIISKMSFTSIIASLFFDTSTLSNILILIYKQGGLPHQIQQVTQGLSIIIFHYLHRLGRSQHKLGPDDG